MKTLNWYKLKENKCPSCGKMFGALNFTEEGFVNCINSMSNCNFRISEAKYMKIVSSQITGELEAQWTKEQEGGEV